MLNAGIINVSNPCIVIMMSGDLSYVISFIIHQAHYEKTDWSRAFNQFTIACGSLDTPSEKTDILSLCKPVTTNNLWPQLFSLLCI